MRGHWWITPSLSCRPLEGGGAKQLICDLSRCGSLLPSAFADARSSDDVIAHLEAFPLVNWSLLESDAGYTPGAEARPVLKDEIAEVRIRASRLLQFLKGGLLFYYCLYRSAR